MEKLFNSDSYRNTFAILVSVVLMSFTIPTTVYICLSPGAKIPIAIGYHYDLGCRGLGNCTHEVKAVSKGSAESKYGLELCGWED